MKEIAAAVDRRVKERLIGATVLVALLVIVVPELLPQARPPRPAPTERTQGDPLEISIDTATSRVTPAVPPPLEPAGGAATAERNTGATAERNTAEPPVPASAAPAPGRAAPPSMASAPATAPARVDSAAKAPISVSSAASPVEARGGAWSVQVGSFASRANAEKLLHVLKAGGSPSYLVASGAGARARYRVRVGPLADRAAAERAATRLKAAGHPGTLVAPGGAG